MSDDDDARAFWLGGYDTRTGIRTQLSVAQAHFNHLAQTEMPECCEVSGAVLGRSPVTNAMIEAGQREQDRHPLGTTGMWSRIYRAMAALAPVELVSAAEDRIGALEAENTKLREDIGYWNETADRLEAENAEAYGYLKRLFQHMAPQCTPLPDLLGVCTQVDNAIAGLKIDLAKFTAANAKPEPKTFPAGALKPSKDDRRRMGPSETLPSGGKIAPDGSMKLIG